MKATPSSFSVWAMKKLPYQMTSAEFAQSFPLFTELSPRAKEKLFISVSEANYEETGEESTYAEFLEMMIDLSDARWDEDEGTVFLEPHAYYVLEALKDEEEVPDYVLAEYPEMVEEFIKKKDTATRLRERRNRQLQQEKDEHNFWKHFK